jgi:hypothetical protein
MTKPLCGLFILLLLCNGLAMAQQTNTPKKLSKKPSRNPELEGIVFTVHNDFLLNLPGSPVKFRNGRSSGVTLSILGNQKFSAESRWSVAAGLGISTRHYFSNIQDWTIAGALYPDSPAVKNKHIITTLDLPLELRFTTREKGNIKPFKFVAGFNVGYVIGYRHKRSIGQLMNITSGDNSNRALIDWRPALTARIGYHRIGISGYYGLTDLFGPSAVYPGVRPWSLGISLLL